MGKLLNIPRKILHAILVVANMACVVGMMVCAASAWIKPQTHPSVSYLGLAFPVFLALSGAFLLFWLTVSVLHIRRCVWKEAAISLAGMVCCAGSIRTYLPINLPKNPPAGALKVVSFNTFSKTHVKGVAAADNDIINYLLAADADIVCLQENNARANSDEDRLLAKVYPHRWYSKEGGEKCPLALLSKHPIVAQGRIDYESHGNASWWFDVVVGADTLLVVNNHFESYKLNDTDKAEYKELLLRREEANVRQNVDSLTTKLASANAIRGAQADSVASFVERHPDRLIILCGDFNDCSISYSHHRLTRQLNDAYTRSGLGLGLSYHRSGMYFRIDNILCSPAFSSYAAHIDRSIKESDHYPIVCRLAK